MDCLYQRSFSLDWPTVSEIRHILKHVLTAISVKNQDIDAAGLVATEYLTNLLRHSQETSMHVQFAMHKLPDKQLLIEFKDSMPSYDLFNQQASGWQLDSGELVEGGMGVALIKHYFPNACYKTVGQQNTFSFCLTNIDKRPTLIYIDDDKAQLALLNAYLSEHFQVICCEDSESGWQEILTSGATILLLDHKLKNGTSEPLLKKLNQSNLKTNLSVVMLTGDDSEELIKRINLLGVDDYLVKPVSKTRLLQSIERIVHRFSALKYLINEERMQTRQKIGEFNAYNFGSIISQNGGDFCMYPHQQQAPVIIGDMMGHGITALKESFAIKGFLSGCLATEIPIQNVLTTLNQALYEQRLCKNSLVTLLISFIENNTLHWFNAGHPAPCVITKNGKLIQLSGTDPLLGLSDDHVYQHYSYDLNDVEHILLFTDGWLDNQQLSDVDQIITKLTDENVQSEEFAYALWQASQVELTAEIDDASLIVINKH
ncbi:MAG: fused two-component system sensor histidine kinase/response regulator/phosphatase [Pseudoalteromonas sp.]|uniref:SpoIIE family protein phosphatase n=1 Tax=unclassified Pseudoalteromonas TaxID=194690 RepID=UPI000C984095|nr:MULTISPECIES: SpoIIE family protein phosphatase [unclassified Pseudoalteromonas]MAD02964.1 fused two-component system sensor histidine kinase/response regulator/phosphatase [Pseudoalteromonas sp.]QWV05910.1 SpoIIE family protein phosphatase [Pseudoalteromonas shioyasakiensis]URQ91994.1 SpoIIE family protein phosphatase [Pseudoalteromonas sp. SCSIO 43101]|tara:strand:+ start:10084 stop:11541 length:1458 start_codon:yes stop_codon:yes gene_type:complete